jgi:hypothetical protein
MSTESDQMNRPTPTGQAQGWVAIVIRDVASFLTGQRPIYFGSAQAQPGQITPPQIAPGQVVPSNPGTLPPDFGRMPPPTIAPGQTVPSNLPRSIR